MNQDMQSSSKTSPLSLERLRILLDAYGGRAEHWPEGERNAALTLVASSEEARQLRAAALDLDELLDLSDTAAVDRELTDRVMASIPNFTASRRYPRSIARYAFAAVPLAAAAALALWVSLPTETAPRVQFAIEDLGQYVTPTDALLDSSTFDVSDNLPSLGCGDSGLGCMDESPSVQRQSTAHHVWRSIA